MAAGGKNYEGHANGFISSIHKNVAVVSGGICLIMLISFKSLGVLFQVEQFNIIKQIPQDTAATFL